MAALPQAPVISAGLFFPTGKGHTRPAFPSLTSNEYPLDLIYVPLRLGIVISMLPFVVFYKVTVYPFTIFLLCCLYFSDFLGYI